MRIQDRFTLKYGDDLYVAAYPTARLVGNPFDADLHRTPTEADEALVKVREKDEVPSPGRLAIVRVTFLEERLIAAKPSGPRLRISLAHTEQSHAIVCREPECDNALLCRHDDATPTATCIAVPGAWQCPRCELAEKDRHLNADHLAGNL